MKLSECGGFSKGGLNVTENQWQSILILFLWRRMMLLQIFDSVVKPLYVKKKTRHGKTVIKTKRMMENVFASQPSISPERHCHQPPASSAAETNQKGRRLILIIIIMIIICQLPQKRAAGARNWHVGADAPGRNHPAHAARCRWGRWLRLLVATVLTLHAVLPKQIPLHDVMFHHVPDSPSETSVTELLQLS